MATQSAGSCPAHSAQFVGESFVDQYFKVLSSHPDLVHKFYKDSSVLSRPGPDGVMTLVTTMLGIKDKILSLDCNGCQTEITTVDAQDSYMGGVIILVTGFWTGKDKAKRRFTQTFFLAQHETGYHVLNDVFRFVDAPLDASIPVVVSDSNEDAPTIPPTPDQECGHVETQQSQSHLSSTTSTRNGSEACGLLEEKSPENLILEEVVVNEPLILNQNDIKSSETSIGEEVVVNEPPPLEQDDIRTSVLTERVVTEPPTLKKNEGSTVVDSTSNGQEVPQKTSYASMVVKASTTPIQRPINIVTVAASSTRPKQRASGAPKPSSSRSDESVTQKNSKLTEVPGQGIFIGNLPLEVSVNELDAILSKFGPVKKERIEIKKCKDGFCYGFVEFESPTSSRSAIKAHHIMVGSKEAYITKRRYSNQASNGRGKLPLRQGGAESHQSVNENGSEEQPVQAGMK